MTDLYSLQGKAALVTGGTGGIGLMIARGLLDAGARVTVASRKADACERAVDELRPHGECRGVTADLSTEAGCRALAEQVAAVEPALHVLVNNAGTAWVAPFEEFPESGWDKVFDLNVKAPFFLTQALLPQLLAAATTDDPARVINIGSNSGERGGLSVVPVPNYSYVASKAALHHLSRILARDLGPRHITVNVIAPGAVDTRMMGVALDRFGDEIVAGTPTGRLAGADDLAGAAVYLASRSGANVNGAVIPVDGGYTTTI